MRALVSISFIQSITTKPRDSFGKGLGFAILLLEYSAEIILIILYSIAIPSSMPIIAKKHG